ncbi:5-(carboxyamino)imidazole ribonucleotide mutase [Candidatus Saccharibacteria bacterium]|nr:5-(carboxyamino)imidazole ribonucleotide mutase [Candidatus Saccharibacteria bacterium]
MSKVMIILGSASDRNQMEPAIWQLTNTVETEVHIMSAHRTPEGLRELVMNSDADVFIAGAGMAAALPGSIAALTPRPVIGVPLSGSPMNGLDALLAIAQMPMGVPVATVAIDGARNAAILALEILGVKDDKAEDAIYKFREDLRRDAAEKDRLFIEHINGIKKERTRD